jgi:hypothetical protein
MKTSSRRTPAKAQPPGKVELALSEEELAVSTEDDGSVVSHPDGYYWVTADGRRQIGPFDSAEEARAQMQQSIDSGWVPGDSLREAEDELGIADWNDPDFGGPAEDTHLRFSDD